MEIGASREERMCVPDSSTVGRPDERARSDQGTETSQEQRAAVTFGSGEVSVIEKVVGFKKVKFHTHENVGYGEVALPELQMHSTAFWLTVPDGVVGSLSAPRVEVVDALRGLGNAMHSVACVGLMIDPRDLGRTLGSRVGQPLMEPTLYFYDEIPGGVGLAPRLFEEREALLSRAQRLIEACPCDDGCPACVGLDVGIGAPRKYGRKRLALAVLAFASPLPTRGEGQGEGTERSSDTGAGALGDLNSPPPNLRASSFDEGSDPSPRPSPRLGRGGSRN
jgi:hypothetical protein